MANCICIVLTRWAMSVTMAMSMAMLRWGWDIGRGTASTMGTTVVPTTGMTTTSVTSTGVVGTRVIGARVVPWCLVGGVGSVIGSCHIARAWHYGGMSSSWAGAGAIPFLAMVVMRVVRRFWTMLGVMGMVVWVRLSSGSVVATIVTLVDSSGLRGVLLMLMGIWWHAYGLSLLFAD